eukprot:jgi/Chlat1/2081/Chrsp17S02810
MAAAAAVGLAGFVVEVRGCASASTSCAPHFSGRRAGGQPEHKGKRRRSPRLELSATALGTSDMATVLHDDRRTTAEAATDRSLHGSVESTSGPEDDGALPKHVAIIMDGNSRWAQQRGLPASVGYERGIEALRRVVRCCRKCGIRALTVFAFSTDNWRRPMEEVSALMTLMTCTFSAQVPDLRRNGVRVRVIGDRSMLPAALQRQIASAEASTADNTDLVLNVAVNYSGRQDVVAACKAVAAQVAEGSLSVSDIDEDVVSQLLSTSSPSVDVSDPDLLIRTSGEQRLSNFLLWQLAYTEFFFTPVLWPDFSEEHFQEALSSFAHRQRRFGARH